MATTTTDFRQRYRCDRIPGYYSGRLHLAFTTAVCLAIIVWCAAQLEAVRPIEWLAVPVTLLYANLAEYLGHRGPMHTPFRGLRLIYQRHSREHHVFFTDARMEVDGPGDFKAVLFPPVMLLFFAVAFALPVGLVLGWLAGANVAYLFVLTSLAYFLNYELLHLAYFLNYELLHLAYHLSERSGVYRLAFLKALRRHHMLHHCPDLMSRYNFNITYPFADWLFGTAYRGTR